MQTIALLVVGAGPTGLALALWLARRVAAKRRSLPVHRFA